MDKETLRMVQLAQLEIAREFKRVCDEYGIKYFMDSGTLLGAVRHKGFIPWDDDMDFGMLREEFDKFVQIAPKVLNKEFYLQTWESDENFPYAFCKLRKKGTRYVEKMFQSSGARQELYIDIFPYDVFPEHSKEQKLQGRKIMWYKYSMLMKCRVYPWLRHEGRIERLLVRIKYFPSCIYSMFHKRNNIMMRYNAVMREHNGENGKNVYEQAGGAPYGKWVVPLECFEKYTQLSFETEVFSAPIDYDLYLKTVYGDYMQLPPEDKRENRHQIIEIKL